MGHPSHSFVSKDGQKRLKSLAQILPKGALDYILDDSGEKILWGAHTGLYGRPKIMETAIFARDT
jgi:hypothetical protein